MKLFSYLTGDAATPGIEPETNHSEGERAQRLTN